MTERTDGYKVNEKIEGRTDEWMSGQTYRRGEGNHWWERKQR